VLATSMGSPDGMMGTRNYNNHMWCMTEIASMDGNKSSVQRAQVV
jgi:hypothetical protein